MKIGVFVVFGAALGLSGCSIDAGAGDGSGGNSSAGSGGKPASAGASSGGSASGAGGGGATSGGATSGGATSGGATSGGATSGGAGGGSSVKPEDSPECTAFCAKLQTMCSFECDKSFDCSIDSGQCAASTIAFLKCVAEKGQVSCGADGYAVIGCSHDKTLCK